MDKPLKYIWVNSAQQLIDVCAQARQQPAIALDTEFVRIRSYYPKLGLIQLFDGMQISLIDPLMIDDFSPFTELLADRRVMKVLHACSEDLDVFKHYFNQFPDPMLDTQIMAGFAGIGTSLGFAKLVNHYLGLELDKGASRTDWLARPLNETQLDYAAADVAYLLPCYQRLVDDLAQTPWQDAVKQECETLLAKRQITVNSDDAYKDITLAWTLNSAQLAILKVLAKWRVEEAQKRDLALNFIVKEQHLVQIAKTQPKHTASLLEFMHPNEVRIHGKKLLWLVEQGKAIPAENYPAPIVRLIDEAGYKQALKALQHHLARIQPENLAPELLASKRQLNQLFKWYKKGQNQEKLPELLIGWRRQYGLQLLEQLNSVVTSG